MYACICVDPLPLSPAHQIYMCACSYYALFKINAFNYNKLIIGATTGAALMQNGSLMARFAAPTCWNFYHIIRFAKDYCSADSQAAGQCEWWGTLWERGSLQLA